ncbi:MAG TPA: hypothetical protein VGF48_23290 [Thermoanaerobaculia bacterium]|jgi:hypothetical protein
MSNALVVIEPETTPELKVIITIDEQTNEVRVTPHVRRVPEGFRGVIRWQIDHPDAVFADPPILFTAGPSTVPPATDSKNCQVWWANDNDGSRPAVFRYVTNLQHGFRHVSPDPTVENDPPRP